MPATAVDLSKYEVINGTYYDRGTPHDLVAVLEACRAERRRVRIFYCSQKDGCDLLEESDIIGVIGRSLGPIKVPLLVPIGDDGGPQLMTSLIGVVQMVSSGFISYQRKDFYQPQMKSVPSEMKGYKWEVHTKGRDDADFSVHARLKTEQGMKRWLETMTLVRGHGRSRKS